MKNLLLFLLLFVCTATAAYGQVGRTSAAVQDAPFSQLTTALPDGQERHCINCGVASDGTCESGVTQAYAIKLSGVWKCSLFNNTGGGGGGGGVTSFNGRVGAVIPTLNDYTFAMIGSKPTTLSGYGITNGALNGLITASGLTMSTGKLLGRSSASTGAIQEITVGSGLSLSGGTLTASGGSGSIGGSGSTNTLAKFTASTTIGNSSITDDGTTVGVAANFSNSGTIISLGTVKGTGLISGATGAFQFVGRSQITSAADGHLLLTNAAGTGFDRLLFKTSTGPMIQPKTFGFEFNVAGAGTGGTADLNAASVQVGPSASGSGLSGFIITTSGGSVALTASTFTSNWTMRLPTSGGSAGQFLQTNGSGITSWTTAVTPSGTLTSNAVLKGAGTSVAIASGVTIDSSDNISTTGSGAFGVGSAVAGNVGVAAGTATAVATNTIQLQAPTSVTGYNLVFPTAAGTGVIQWTNSSNVMTGTIVTGSTTVASGTVALGTGAISSATCATAVTDTATGTATTDVVSWGFNGDPTAITGYVPLTSGMLTIIAYPASNSVGFRVCNNTTGSITPGAVTLNYRVVR